MSNIEGQETFREQMVPEEEMQMANEQQVAAENDSDEEFRLMDEQIQAQVVIEKRKQQL